MRNISAPPPSTPARIQKPCLNICGQFWFEKRIRLTAQPRRSTKTPLLRYSRRPLTPAKMFENMWMFCSLENTIGKLASAPWFKTYIYGYACRRSSVPPFLLYLLLVAMVKPSNFHTSNGLKVARVKLTWSQHCKRVGVGLGGWNNFQREQFERHWWKRDKCVILKWKREKLSHCFWTDITNSKVS